MMGLGMKNIEGDFWDYAHDYDALVCTTNCVVKANGELVMGAGIAKQFASKFYHLPKVWGSQLKGKSKKLESCVFVHRNSSSSYLQGKFLIAFPTKYDWREKSDIKLIERSAFQLLTITEAFGWTKVLMPRPGCANGGLTWEEVEPILKRWLDHRFYVVERKI